MIVVSDTLCDCILLIKIFDNHAWIFKVLHCGIGADRSVRPGCLIMFVPYYATCV